MAAFNPRHLAREIPASSWRAYLRSRSIGVPEDFNWFAEEKEFSKTLICLLESLDPSDQAKLYAELRHVHALATPRGIDAFRNASNDEAKIREEFAKLRNDAERALWVLVNDPGTFMAAEALLRFDLGVGKRSWKRLDIRVSKPVSREAAHIHALEEALTEALSKRKSPKRACHVDICDRHLDGGTQVSVYLEDDPNDLVEFVGDGMCRRTTRPATNLALVYYQESGIVDTVGRGGAKVHEPLVTLFAKHLLGKEVRPEAVKRPVFHLNRLRNGLDLPADSDIDLASYGVERITLRRARLRSTQAPICDFTINVPAKHSVATAYRASQSHLGDHDLFRGHSNILEVLISVHFFPSETGKQGRVLNIELRASGTSNLRDLAEDDAKFAECLLRAWRVMDPAEVELHRAA